MFRSLISLRASLVAVSAFACQVLFVSVLNTAFLAMSADAAPIAYSSSGSTYTQNFDTLASSPQAGNFTWTDGTTLTGWYANINGAVPPTYRVNNGSAANTLSLQSNGSVGGTGSHPDSDRALGTQSNTASTLRTGVAFTNNLTQPLYSFTAIYDGEEWRRITNEGADGYVVEYRIFNSGLGSLTAAGAWNALPTMNFSAPNVGSASATTALDGNLFGNRVAGLTATVNNLNWQPGQELWIRFTDSGPAQHQLAIDNFSFTAMTAAPEPSSVLLLGLGVLGLLRRTRRGIQLKA